VEITKKFFSVMLAGLLAVSAFAGTVRVTLNGNKNFVVSIDGISYTATTVSNGAREILITTLQTGQHSIEILRANNRGVNKQIYSSSFDLGQYENMHITVSANGGVRIEESASNDAYGSGNGSSYGSPMSDATYNQLFRSISNQRGQASRLTAAKDAFNSTYNYFTAYQAGEIIRLLNSEANRLTLAKIAYDNLTDPYNYTQFHQLLNRQSSIDDLDNYVRNNSTYTNGNNGSNNYHPAMTDANYNTLYNKIRKQWLPGAKMSAARDAFNTSTNYFTTTQARNIIGLVSSEVNRLELAKLSYDNITDPSNFRQLYDLFSDQASIDELDAYVRNNPNYQY